MYNNMNSSVESIGGFFDKQIPLNLHRGFTFTLMTPRTAFLAIIRLNVWGMATIFSKKAFLVDQKTTDASKMGEYWWDIQKKLRNAWWNVGGSWSSLVNAINAGKGKKFLGASFAPKKIKDALKSKGINGTNSQGIGDPVTAASFAATATPIIGSLMPLILLVIGLISKDKGAAVEEFDFDQLTENDGDGDGKGKGKGDGEGFEAGAGLIGVGILAALYFGTEKKAKQKK